MTYQFLPEEFKFTPSHYKNLYATPAANLHFLMSKSAPTKEITYSIKLNPSNSPTPPTAGSSSGGTTNGNNNTIPPAATAAATPLNRANRTLTPLRLKPQTRLLRRRRTHSQINLFTAMFHSPSAEIFVPCLAGYIRQEIYVNQYSPSGFDKPDFTVSDLTTPTLKKIKNFLNIFIEKNLIPQCMVAGVIYLDRIKSKVKLNYLNWKRLLLVVFIVAEKTLVDEIIWNTDYQGIIKTDLKVINRLEKIFLKEIEYHLAVSTAEYGNYYFSILSLVDQKEEDQNEKRDTKKNYSFG